ncbi:hypothetical protein [Streptomyces sp. NPDC051572]|uniref:hypothetical protein n=1 Tax=unclassified Streptomyces TaxID=2593676 RepID=UPI00344B19D1
MGTALRSAVDSVEVIVVRAPKEQLDLRCGGAPLLGPDETARGGVGTEDTEGPGTLLGKRYHHEPSGLELLCVKPGPGTLSANGEPLPVKTAKQLPSSD